MTVATWPLMSEPGRKELEDCRKEVSGFRIPVFSKTGYLILRSKCFPSYQNQFVGLIESQLLEMLLQFTEHYISN